MEQRVRLLEECRGTDRNRHGCIPEVVFKEYEVSNLSAFYPSFWKFQLLVNGDEYSGWREIHETRVQYTELEAYIGALTTETCKFQLALNSDRTVCLGFLMYHMYAECILYVRGMYVEPGFEKAHIGHRLLKSLGKPIKKIIFQTQINCPPERLLGMTVEERSEIHRTDKLITWEMPWKG